MNNSAQVERFRPDQDGVEKTVSNITIKTGGSKRVQHGPNTLRVECDKSGDFGQITLLKSPTGVPERGALIYANGDETDEFELTLENPTINFDRQHQVVIFPPTDASLPIEIYIPKED